MPFNGIRVEGLAELQRALREADRAVAKDLRAELKKAGEPVRARAESRASSGIRNIGGKWSRMKLGATGRMVYIAPAARPSGGSARPNLAPLLLQRAMVPAVSEKRGEVEEALEAWIDRVNNQAGF